jgi:DNA-binding NarL/FixJ family response regulator
VLDHTTGLRCARTFEDCEAALALLRSGFPVDAPRVILLDVHLPGMNGLEGIRHLKATMPLAAIIMLTISDHTDTIFTAFRAGASGYLPKSAPIDQIVTAVREAAQGGTLMPSLVAQKVLGYLVS